MQRFVFFSFLFACIIAVNHLQAQQKEEEELYSAFKNYSEFRLGKIDSLPKTPANYDKVLSRLNNSFKQFVLHPNSQYYSKFKPAKNDSRLKFFRLDNGVEIDADSFIVDSTMYVVFGYRLQDDRNYFIKRLTDNRIVFDGNGKTAAVDGMYLIEKNRILLVEEDGDRNTNRKASVIATDAKNWKQVKAFKGKAFGQVPFEYYTKKFVEKRMYFQLACGMEELMLAPEDVNDVSFNEKTKTLSYKQYTDKSRFKTIEARYENGLFMIDDYKVSESFSAEGTAIPE